MPVKVLLVEDDSMLCTVFEMFISSLGYELIGVNQNGEDAIELINVNKPDIILMDIHLDGKIDGIEASRIIYEKHNLPVIYISSDIEDKTVKRAILPNTYGFLVKPIYKKTLETTIKFALAKHELDKKNKMKTK